MALGARKREARGGNVQPTPLSRQTTSRNQYGKNREDQDTTAQNPALSAQNAKGVLKLGTQYKLGKM